MRFPFVGPRKAISIPTNASRPLYPPSNQMSTRRSLNITSLNPDPSGINKSGLPINQVSPPQSGPSNPSNPIASPNASTIVLDFGKLAVIWTPTTPGTIDIGLNYVPNGANGIYNTIVQLPDGSNAEGQGLYNTGLVYVMVPKVLVHGTGWQVVLSWNESQSLCESKSDEFSILPEKYTALRRASTSESALKSSKSNGAMVTANGELSC